MIHEDATYVAQLQSEVQIDSPLHSHELLSCLAHLLRNQKLDMPSIMMNTGPEKVKKKLPTKKLRSTVDVRR